MLINSNGHVNSFEEDNVMKLYNVQTDYKVKKKAPWRLCHRAQNSLS